MLTALDHVIIGVNELEQATTHFRARLGLVASGGGVHPAGGTANRIIVIGETYLEMISVQKPQEAQESMLARLKKCAGYLNFVLASDAIEPDSQAMRARGVAVIGPNTGELRSANGHTRGWARTDVEWPDLAQHYPFIIQHDSTGEERRFRLAGQQTPPEHPLGALRVLSTTIVVANLAEAQLRFQGIYALKPMRPDRTRILNTRMIMFPLGTGDQHFELIEPLSAQSITPANQPGASFPTADVLRQHLQQFGESLWCMTLAVQNLAAARKYLDDQQVAYHDQETEKPEVWIDAAHACGAVIVLREAE